MCNELLAFLQYMVCTFSKLHLGFQVSKFEPGTLHSGKKKLISYLYFYLDYIRPMNNCFSADTQHDLLLARSECFAAFLDTPKLDLCDAERTNTYQSYYSFLSCCIRNRGREGKNVGRFTNPKEMYFKIKKIFTRAWQKNKPQKIKQHEKWKQSITKPYSSIYKMYSINFTMAEIPKSL